MNSAKVKTPGAGGRSGASEIVTKVDVPNVAQTAAAGKTLAVMLYKLGARSLDETQAAFAPHPKWWRA